VTLVISESPYRPIVERFGISSDPSLNGNFHYPNDIDRSLNETVTDKIRKYLTDYNNNPPSGVSFMTVMGSTSGRLHSEFIRLLFLLTHRETDRFFATTFSVKLKEKVGSTSPTQGVYLKFPATTSRERLLRNHWDLVPHGGGKECLTETNRPGFFSPVRPDLPQPTHGLEEEGSDTVVYFSREYCLL
jgi:hypothetical protein